MGGNTFVWDSNGVWVPTVAVPGVVDTSNAPAGTVGEFLSTTGTAHFNTYNINDRPPSDFNTPAFYNIIATLALSAGDWEVGGMADVRLDDEQNLYILNVYLSSPEQTPNWPSSGVAVNNGWFGASTGGAITPPAPITSQMGGSLGPIRINTNAPVTAQIAVQQQCDFAGTAHAYYVLWARRMR